MMKKKPKFEDGQFPQQKKHFSVGYIEHEEILKGTDQGLSLKDVLSYWSLAYPHRYIFEIKELNIGPEEK